MATRTRTCTQAAQGPAPQPSVRAVARPRQNSTPAAAWGAPGRTGARPARGPVRRTAATSPWGSDARSGPEPEPPGLNLEALLASSNRGVGCAPRGVATGGPRADARSGGAPRPTCMQRSTMRPAAGPPAPTQSLIPRRNPPLEPDHSTPDFDTCALRHLVFAPPAATSHLSSLTVAHGRVLRRYAVRGATGERCVITLDFRRASAGAGAAGWELARAHGEPEHAGLPLGPSRFNTPESVVAAVVAALRDMDAFTALRFLAPPARARLGGTAERLAAALEAPALRALLLHGGAERGQARQRGAERYEEIVRVESVTGGEPRGWGWGAGGAARPGTASRHRAASSRAAATPHPPA